MGEEPQCPKGDNAVLGVIHSDACSVPSAGCCASPLGAEASVRHGAATGRKAWRLKGAGPMRFGGFDNGAQTSGGTVDLDSVVMGYRHVAFVVRVVPGAAGFLMSKPDVKALGAAIDLDAYVYICIYIYI